MPLGPGKYDAICTRVREEAKAKAVIVIVLGGELGSGFTVQAEADMVLNLSELLRRTADDIDSSMVRA